MAAITGGSCRELAISDCCASNLAHDGITLGRFALLFAAPLMLSRFRNSLSHHPHHRSPTGLRLLGKWRALSVGIPVVLLVALTTADCALGQGPVGENLSAGPAGDLAPQSVPVTTGWLTAGYCVLIILASLVGGWIPAFVKLTHTRMQTVISFVGGLMLGIGVFHLLPHAVYELPSANSASRWMMVGIVFMFIMLRLFHFHNHEPDAAHDHHHDDSHAHSAAECHSHGHTHGISWLGIAIGLSIHTLIDGIALAASVNSQAATAVSFTLYGFGTFLAICLHKPLDAVSITSLMHAGGWSARRINLVNTGFALMCPLGAAITLLGVHQFPAFRQEILGPALAFSAGVFICISLSDLLPEMEFHSHNKVQLSAALALGLGLSWAITWLEPAHLH